MQRVDRIEKDVAQVEGFAISFFHTDGRDVRGDKELPNYPRVKAASNDITVAQWRE
jgi:hypothetical protein